MVGLCAPLASAPVSSCCFCHFFLSAWAAQTLGKQRLEVKCRLVWATPRPPNAASFCCVEQSAHSPWPLEAPDTGGHRVISGRYCGNYSTPTSLFYRLKVQSPRISAASESSWSCTGHPASRPLPSRGAGASGGRGAAAWLPGAAPVSACRAGRHRQGLLTGSTVGAAAAQAYHCVRAIFHISFPSIPMVSIYATSKQ